MDSAETREQKLLESKKQEIVDALNEGLVNLQFKKVNGELRNMCGTRNLNIIAEEYHPKGEGKTISDPDSVVTLFDVEANGWRSFRVENLIEYRSKNW